MKLLTAVSFGLALFASCLLLVLPVYSISSSESNSLRHATFICVNGPMVLMALAIRVLIAWVPLLIPKFSSRMISGVILLAFAVISGFSIGRSIFRAPHNGDGRSSPC